MLTGALPPGLFIEGAIACAALLMVLSVSLVLVKAARGTALRWSVVIGIAAVGLCCSALALVVAASASASV